MVAPDHVKGYIYVESYKQTHVKSAIEGIGNLRIGLWNQQMVPIKEMTDVLKVVKEVTNLKPKSWVRLKRGLYKDDIAQVPADRTPDSVNPGFNVIIVLVHIVCRYFMCRLFLPSTTKDAVKCSEPL